MAQILKPTSDEDFDFFKSIKEANAAINANELDNPEKIVIVETAASKLSTVLCSTLCNAKLHTTTRRFIERESKLQDALFYALGKILEVKTYSHFLKREDLEKLKNTKVSVSEINEVLEKLNHGLITDYGLIINKIVKIEQKLAKETTKELLFKLEKYKKEKILISQLQEIVATYLAVIENDYNV